jgi:phosphoribosyl 1,2-cyclic phosphodiesterase
MSLFICSLNSGSNGNCYYVGHQDAAILVDVGVSARIITKRLAERGLNIKNIKGIFVSHEHTDHIRGVSLLARQNNIPIYISENTYTHSFLNIMPELVVYLDRLEPTIHIDDLAITPFKKIHDAADPYSFTIQYGDISVAVITDIGYACEQVIQHFSQCHAAFLECNYDEDLLHNGRYPLFLKRRISGGRGHISNKQAYKLFLEHKSPHLSHLLLSHLSAQNNTPEHALALFKNHAEQLHISVAPRHEASPVFEVKGSYSHPLTSSIYQQELPF